MLVFYVGAALVAGLFLSVFFVMILAGVIGPVSNLVQWLVAIPTVAGCAILGLWFWSEKLGVRSLFRRSAGDTHGSARLATPKEIAATLAVGVEDDGLLIGRDPKTKKLLGYHGPAHLLTLAPTRAGKGVGTVIPNLLLSGRSMLVVDPKGENVRVAGAMRADYGPTFVLDPFGVSGTPGASYNPLDRMTADSLDLGEDASTLAAALVIDPPGQAGEAHWNEEARALIAGLILFCVVHEDPERKTLGTVREYLTLPPERFRELLGLMQESRGANGLIARAANRFLGKADREAAGVPLRRAAPHPLSRQPEDRPEPCPLRLPLRRSPPPAHHGLPGAAAEPDGRLQPLAAPHGLRGPAGHRPRRRGRQRPGDGRWCCHSPGERPGGRRSATRPHGAPDGR